MNRSLLASTLVIAGLLSSCAPLYGVSTVVPVETAVALTLEAIVAAASPAPTEPVAPLQTAAPDVLPHPLYFRKQDAAALWQLYRQETDGTTTTQITFEPFNVDAYGVSPTDGSIAFISNNQLFLVDASGAGRRLLVDGGPIDTNNPWGSSLSAPVWAPDGRTLAYGHDGLNFIDPQTGTINKALQNQIDSSPGFPLVKEMYAPRSYSPDGSKLLMDIGYYEGGTYGIFLPANNAVVRFQREDGAIVCCRTAWIPDGSGVYITSPEFGMHEAGLFYADAATGQVSILLPGAAPDGTYNFAQSAQVGADNQLYFFFNNLSQIPDQGRTPLYLVRSAPDGVTDRSQLLPDPFMNINEYLWSPDTSLVVVLAFLDPSDFYGGEARAVYLDGRPAVTLFPYGRDLRWGP